MASSASSSSAPIRWFIASLPPPAIQSRANQVIQELHDLYGTRTAHCPPHITLKAPFEWPINAIYPVEQGLAEFSTNQAAVPIALDGFGSFRQRVLFIDVVKSSELLTLQANLVVYLDAYCGVKREERHKTFNPHMTVASRKVTRPIFRQAWAELKFQAFTGEFIADRITLLRYEPYQWHVHREFELKG